MFMRRPSPLSLKVRSKFAELYLLPKKEVFNIAKNYRNIWSKIHKKDFHNMLSIKHQTFNILNKYIEINGIRKITPIDVSRFVYSWEDQDKKNKMFNNKYSEKNITNKDIIDYNKSYDKKYLYFSKNSQKLCPSPIRLEKMINQNNKENNNNYHFYNLFSNQSLDIFATPKNKEQQTIPTETDFSHLLKIIANGKQKSNNLNDTNTNTNNTNKNNNSNNIQIINDNNCNIAKESSRSLASNFFNDKKKTKNSYEEGNTIILPKNSELLLPTLNNIFNEKKAEEIKNEMKKTRKKENRKKIISFGKKIAELFRNENYSIFLVGKATNEFIEINKNNFELSNKSSGIEQELNQYITLCRDNNFLDKIPEISSSDEYSFKKFEKKDLSQEEVISFTLNSIYQNINIHTKMKYSENKYFQQKTLTYLTKLIEKDSYSPSSSDSNISESNSIFFTLSDNDKKSSFIDSNVHKEANLSLSNSMLNRSKSDHLLYENSISRSENTKKIKQKKSNKKKNEKLYYSEIPCVKGDLSDDKKKEYDSLHLKYNNLDSMKNKNKSSSVFKKDVKFTFKNESTNNNEKSSENEFNSIFNSNQKKNSKLILTNLTEKKNNHLNINQNKNALSLFSDNIINSNINNIKTIKNTASKKRSDFSERVFQSRNGSIKGKLTKKYTKKYTKKITKKNTKKSKLRNSAIKNNQSKKFRSEQKLVKINPKNFEGGNNNNSAEYFAKEEKEECIII